MIELEIVDTVLNNRNKKLISFYSLSFISYHSSVCCAIYLAELELFVAVTT